MGLKDIYNSAEDKYYEIIDSIDKTIPITKITDAIDSVVPSFALLLVLIVLVLGFLLWPVIFPAETISYKITVEDENGNFLEGINASITPAETGKGDLMQGIFTTNEKGEINSTARKGTEIIIEIKNSGYEEEKRNAIIEEQNQKIIFKLKKLVSEEPAEATLRFTDSGGQRITGKEITVKLSCRNSSVVPSPSIVRDSDKDGEIIVPIPKDCDKLMVDSVEVLGFEEWNGMVNGAVLSIKLDSISEETDNELTGDLRVVVQDSDGNPLDGIKVNLMKGNSTIKQEYSDSGEVQFIGVLIGEYDLVLQDSENNYAIKKVYSVEIYNQTVTKEIVEMKLTQKGTLKVTVKDIDTGTRIENAEVLITGNAGEILGEENTGEDGLTVEFALFSDEEITIIVRHEDYLPETTVIEEISKDGTEITIELEKITSANSGKLNITLVDEENKKVANARVMILNEDKSFATQYPEKFSDAKGDVNYSGIKEGSYIVRAEKFPASAQSDLFEINLTEITSMTVKMTIGNAKIHLKTIDNEGNPIPFTRVKVKSLDKENEYPLDEKGETELLIKADKRVFFEFYDPEDNYAKYTTKEYQLFPEEIKPEGYEIVGVMSEQIAGQGLWVELKGVYSDGIKQDVLVGGRPYIAVFELFVPTDESFDSAGIHVRVGEDSHVFMENDIVSIRKINAPDATKIKGKTWNPVKGEDIDLDVDNSASSNAEGKWANIVWDKVQPGRYQAEVEIKINEQATDSDEISIKYRAWGKGQGYYYFPADNDLGATKQMLYAETLETVFNAAEEIPICEENNLCMSGQILLDLEEEPFITQKKLPFKTKTFGTYEYEFKIANNSLSTYDEPEIWIKLIDPTENNGQYVETKKAEIAYYEIKRADGTIIKNTELNDNSTQGIELGKFMDQSVIEGTIGIKTKNAGSIYANVSIIEKTNKGSNEIFNNEQKTQIKISSEKELVITAKPEFVPAWVETPIEITVKDDEGIEVENALITFSVIESENTETLIDAKYSSKFGKAEFNIMQWDPKTTIKFTAKKFGYETGIKEIILSEQVFELLPENINETLSKRDNPLVTKEITIINLLETDLKIYGINLKNEVGYFGAFIDTERMQGKFDGFKGQTVEAFPQEFNAEIFEAKLQNGLQDDYTGTAKGIMTVSLINEEFDAVYDKEIEVNLSLGIGEEIDNASCLEIVSGETQFSRQTTSQPVQLAYTIENTCSDNTGKGIRVNNLKARVEWASSKKGEVSLQMSIPSSGQKTATLKTTEFTEFFSNVNAKEEFQALLTYTPNTELLGEEGTGEFTVVIEAELVTADGKQVIQTSPSSIQGKIGNVDLIECIEFDPKPKIGTVIESDSDETEFIITNNCGMEVDLRFCDGDNRCNGGTEEGGIIVTPKTIIDSLTLGTGNNNAGKVKVEKTSIPGIYGMKIEAKISGESWREIAVYDVLVKPNNGYFSLADYTIAVPETNVKDIIELKNERLYADVKVTASDCDWETASDTWGRWDDGIKGFGAGGASAAGAIVVTAILSKAVALSAMTGPVGIAIMVGVAVIGSIICIFACPDPCDNETTTILQDNIIRLSTYNDSSDLNGISLSLKGIEVGWNFEDAVLDFINNAPPGKETIPLYFEKTTSDYDNIKPAYGILTIDAIEHPHKDTLKVPRGNSNFGPFNLPEYYSGRKAVWTTNSIKKKFHVRAITKRFIEEIPPINTSLDCVRPTGEIGGIGEQALPKVKLDWEWNSIAFNECEQSNENYVYCDSTQFAIMLNKRIHKIDEFMKENNYGFDCPENPIEKAANSNWEKTRMHDVAEGKIGISQVQINTNKETNKTTIDAVILNKNISPMEAKVTMNLTVPEGTEYAGETECIKETGMLGLNSSKTVSCEFVLPKTEEAYKVEVRHVPQKIIEDPIERVKYDSFAFNINFTLFEEKECWAGTSTIDTAGVFPLNLYLNKLDPLWGEYVKQEIIKFQGNNISTDDTKIINVIENVKELSHFNVYMMKDGFSQDFKEDFADYYENAFLGSATWFTDGDSDTTNNELAEYFKQDGLLSFNRKYLREEKYELPEPGLYRVDIQIDYTGDKWSLFDVSEKPNAEIRVEFTRLNTPNVDSIFYYMPFDGKVGEENFAYHRIGYGAGYTNLKEENLNVNNNTVLSSSNTSSAPIQEILIEKSNSLNEMNSDEETRGSILNLNYDGSDIKMKFAPSKATPVVLRMWHEQTSSTNEFTYYYGMQESNLPVLAGDKLAFWRGLGRCRGFEGKFLQNYKRWDTQTGSESQSLYEVAWNNAVKGGDTYLKTILYTPVERNINLKVEEDVSVKKSALFTPNEKNSKIIRLNGITGMQYNNANQQSSSYLKNIKNVFDLVKQGKLCISQNDSSLNVYWNEQELYRTKGADTGQSINDLEESLVAGDNCIE